MSTSKVQISAPLEAGQSLLGSQHLPAPLTTALEYVSNGLAKKQITLSLILVRRSPQTSEPSSPQYAAASPARSLFASVAKKTLSRSSSVSSISSYSSLSNSPASPTGSTYSSSGCASPTSPNPWGISLIHACTLTQKEEKALRLCISKAEKKFAIGSGWLSEYPLTTAITCPRTNNMIRRSLKQNRVLFSSEGLTLFALDQLYTFKCQLYTYSRSLSHHDMALAVDDLHRLVLSHGGRPISKGYLIRAYDWLGFNNAALAVVNEHYKRAYGGARRIAGIDTQDADSRSPPPLKTSFAAWELKTERATTPNTWEELTPVTKGEWLCLMVGDGWEEPKTAPVVSCLA